MRIGRLAIPLILSALVVGTALGESNIRKRTRRGEEIPTERAEQASIFNRLFLPKKLQYITRYSELKKKATVSKWRIPYSASIHPENRGGMSRAGSSGPVFRRYDLAFNKGRSLAYSYDRSRKLRVGRRLFGGTYHYYDAESWEGYCSGFTASTIRHPEPVRAVDASKVGGKPGVVFQPEDIKALLSAIYNRTRRDSYVFVAPATSRYGGPNMGTFHLALTNYIGQADYPVGIDRTKGRVSWNNPVYKYEIVSERDAGRRGSVHYKEIVNKITYTWYGNDRTQQSDLNSGERQKHLHRSMNVRYYLELDDKGDITGGRALSHEGHFLWIPLFAVQGIRNQTSPGNPHIEVAKVLALARESALPIVQSQYDKVVVGKTTDPQIAVRAERERQRRLAEIAKREKKEREVQARAKAAAAAAAAAEQQANAARGEQPGALVRTNDGNRRP